MATHDIIFGDLFTRGGKKGRKKAKGKSGEKVAGGMGASRGSFREQGPAFAELLKRTSEPAPPNWQKKQWQKAINGVQGSTFKPSTIVTFIDPMYKRKEDIRGGGQGHHREAIMLDEGNLLPIGV